MKINNSASVAVGASITFLGFNVSAMIKGTGGDDVQVLVLPGITDGEQKVTFGELIGKISSTIKAPVDTKSLNSVLSYIGLSLDTLVCLNMAFALYDSSVADEQKQMEYAFSVSIENPKTDKENNKSIFEFNSLSFAIWNSQRPSIISKMGLTSIEDMLGRIDKGEELPPVLTANSETGNPSV